MLSKNWVNPQKKFAFAGVNKIYNHYTGGKTVNEIKNELSGIRTYTLHKENKKIKNYNPFFIYKKHQQWQIDICYIPNIPSKSFPSKYILCVLEVFSRKLYIKELIKKDKKTVLEAFKEIHSFIGVNPTNIFCDSGGEFTNNLFKKYCKDNSIKLIFSRNETKAAHVERAQRTFQGILYRVLEEFQTKNSSKILNDVLFIYNNRVNRITGFSPNDAYLDRNAQHVLINLEKYYASAVNKKKKPKYGVGTPVRISLKKHSLEKGYNPTFSEEVFKIKNVLLNLPQPRYILETYDSSEKIDGTFYEREITLATHKDFKIEKILRTRKKGAKTEYFVKWVGFPNSQNSWVKKADIKIF